MLKDLQEHANDFAQLLQNMGYKETSDWLFLSAGILTISYKWNRFDKTESQQWCRPAWEYDVARGEILNDYLEKLTIFNYIWGGFENLTNEVFTKSQIRKFGKVNLVTKLIKEKGYFPVYEHHTTKTQFSKLNKQLFPYGITLTDFFDHHGTELQLIYKIRNKFAHGDLEFPEAKEYSLKDPKILIHLISLSSRLTLFYMQTLLIHYRSNDLLHFYCDSYFDNVDFNELPEEIFSSYLLSRIHLKSFPEKDKLNTLFDEEYFDLII